MSIVFVTGAGGFIGSHLAERLLEENYRVVGWDNFSTGQNEFMDSFKNHSRFRLVKGDNLDFDSLLNAMKGCDIVFHLAANADVRFGLDHPSKDLHQNTIATFNILEAMRLNRIQTIYFPSTGSVYGEAKVIPTPENTPFPIQTSLYGASKLAGEGLIEAYAEGYGLNGAIFRFVSVLGERYSHGHVFDFYQQLLNNPDRLKVLGDGTQKKSYLYIQDCVDAMMHILKQDRENKSNKKVEIYNLGTPEYCQVKDSIQWICEHLRLKPKVEFSGGDRGWIGDNPFIFLDISKIQSTGWTPKVSIKEGVVRTLSWLSKNKWILERN